MTDLQLAVVLEHIARQIKAEVYSLNATLPYDEHGLRPTNALALLYESIYRQADDLRGKWNPRN